jgi:hypothetical protein
MFSNPGNDAIECVLGIVESTRWYVISIVWDSKVHTYPGMYYFFCSEAEQEAPVDTSVAFQSTRHCAFLGDLWEAPYTTAVHSFHSTPSKKRR